MTNFKTLAQNQAKLDSFAAGEALRYRPPVRALPMDDNLPLHAHSPEARPEQQGFGQTPTPPPPSIEWKDPTPLPNALPPVAKFDAQLLPEAFRDWIQDISHRMQCPPDFAAVGALVTASSLIGARAVVKPKARDDWSVTPNLWGMIVGRPGVMKSPALSQTMAPLTALEAAQRECWRAEHEAWEIDCQLMSMVADADRKAAQQLVKKDPTGARALLEQNTPPPEPKARRYIASDVTLGKLGDLLITNPWGMLVYRDELHGLLCSMDSKGEEGARGFYLTAYDGNQSCNVDRLGRGELFIPRVCLAMLGGIQPGKLQSYVRDAVSGGSGDDGLLQRFGLAVWPDVDKDFVHVDQWPDNRAKQQAVAVFDRLNQLQATSDTAEEWHFSPEAQTLFAEWVVPFETEIRGDDLHPALAAHLAKYRKLIPALALVFALIDTPDSGRVIHENELVRALAWGDYLRTHAERIYAGAVVPETGAAQTLLNKIKTGKMIDSDGPWLAFTPRMVAVKHWAGLGTPDAVRKAADVLVAFDYLKVETTTAGSAGGRSSDRYMINPALPRGHS
jgi:putative DNA primase/helicase